MSIIFFSLCVRCIQACPVKDDAGQRGSNEGALEGHRQTEMSLLAWCLTHTVFSIEELQVAHCTSHQLKLMTALAWYWIQVVCTIKTNQLGVMNKKECALPEAIQES